MFACLFVFPFVNANYLMVASDGTLQRKCNTHFPPSFLIFLCWPSLTVSSCNCQRPRTLPYRERYTKEWRSASGSFPSSVHTGRKRTRRPRSCEISYRVTSRRTSNKDPMTSMEMMTIKMRKGMTMTTGEITKVAAAAWRTMKGAITARTMMVVRSRACRI